MKINKDVAFQQPFQRVAPKTNDLSNIALKALGLTLLFSNQVAAAALTNKVTHLNESNSCVKEEVLVSSSEETPEQAFAAFAFYILFIVIGGILMDARPRQQLV